MTSRTFSGAVMPALVALVLAGSVQTASAAGTFIHQYRLNEFTGSTDDFGSPSLVPIVATDSDGAGPSGVAALRSEGAVPAALVLAPAPRCAAGTSGAITRLCQGYVFGFTQGLTLARGPGGANEDAENYLVIIEMLISDGRDRRRFLDF